VLLDKLDELGVADNTIVIYSTDNGPHRNTLPDAGTTWFRSEKNTNWEGAYRVPCLLRWPGKVEPGSVSNEIVGSHDWLPTLVHAAGEPDVVDKLKTGYEANGKTYKVHIDGYDMTPYLSGDAEEHSRPGFIYFSDDGDVVAMRYHNWKFVFMEQETKGTLYLWMNPFKVLRIPKIFNSGPIRLSTPTSHRTRTLTSCCDTSSCSRQRRRSSPSSWRPSRSPTPTEGPQLQHRPGPREATERYPLELIVLHKPATDSDTNTRT
jgi:hypothetical protein